MNGADEGVGAERRTTGACAYPWQQMIIDLTGEVVPCCFWSGYGNGGKPLGNTNEQTLDQIWNGPAWRALRRANASGSVAGTPCGSCLAHRWAGGTYPRWSWPAAFAPESGLCHMARLPDSFLRAAAGVAGAWRVLEDGAALPHADAPHDDIRRLGGGRHSVWGEWLYLSTTDGSDPAVNGRRYEVERGGVRCTLGTLRRDCESGRNLLAAFEEYKAGAEVLASRPTMVSYIASADCNIDCPACSQNAVRRVDVRHRERTERDVLTLAPSLQQLVWHGGEPWLLAGFRAFVDGFRPEHNPNLAFGFTTNGTLLDADELAKLERFPRLNASISMDSFRAETFERVRAGARFGAVLANTLRAMAAYDAPRRVFSVGLLAMKSTLAELPFNVRFALEHDIGLNVGPVVVYPVTEQLDVFEDVEAQTRGWDAALAEALMLVREARAQGRPAVRRVDPEGMLAAIADIVAVARARLAGAFELRLEVHDPHGSLPAMRRPGVIVSRQGQAQPLAYAELRGQGEALLRVPEAACDGPVELMWTLCHDLLEPMGVVDMDVLRDARGNSLASVGWRGRPSRLRLELPRFAPLPRVRNAARARAGRATPDGLNVLAPGDIHAAYLRLVQREALAGLGLRREDGGLPDDVLAEIDRRAGRLASTRYIGFGGSA